MELVVRVSLRWTSNQRLTTRPFQLEGMIVTISHQARTAQTLVVRIDDKNCLTAEEPGFRSLPQGQCLMKM